MQIITNKKIILFSSFVFLFIIVSLIFINSCLAFDKSVSDYLDELAQKPELDLKHDTTMPYIVGKIINGVLGFLGVICLILIIYGGFRIMLAGGSEEDVTAGRQTIKWAVIGVIVVIGAYALSYYVVNELLQAQRPPRPAIPLAEQEENELEDCTLAPCENYGGIYPSQNDPGYLADWEACLSWVDSFSHAPCCQWMVEPIIEEPGKVIGDCLHI